MVGAFIFLFLGNEETLDGILKNLYDEPLNRGIAQPGSAPALGAGCREFESLYPDHEFDLRS
jgi:hypothetical protein